MTEATCRRELELEIPAEEVTKASDKIVRDIAKVARVPGFRPGKAPATLIRRRFADDIRSELLQQLVPERIDQALTKDKLVPVTQPQVDKVEYTDGNPLKFRAIFEVLPEFELKPYTDLEIEVNAPEVTDADVEKTLTEMRERAATFKPIEDRAIANGDYAQLKLVGTPKEGGEPLRAENVMCHIGAEETLETFNENLRGAKTGDQRTFDISYPADYRDPNLAGKSYTYVADVTAIKEKQLPDLNDEFAKDVSESKTLDELRVEIRKRLEEGRESPDCGADARQAAGETCGGQRFSRTGSARRASNGCSARTRRPPLSSQGSRSAGVNVDWAAMRADSRTAHSTM